MLSADPLDHFVVHSTLTSTHRIPAEDVYGVCPYETVTQFLHLYGSFRITVFPQQMHALSEDCNARMVHLRGLQRRRDEVAKSSHKQGRIRSAIAHECG